MWGRWNTFGFQLSCCAMLMLLSEIQKSVSINLEGLDLLEFRARVDIDPYGAFENWNFDDTDPCMWLGVHCVDGKVHMLDLTGFSLGGMLAPELGKLSHLRSLVLYKNHLSGSIPKEFGGLKMLELLDLRNNSLNGMIPAEIGGMMSLKRLLLCGNSFQGSFPPQVLKLNFLAELQLDQNISTKETDCVNRKFGHCIWNSVIEQLKKTKDLFNPMKGVLIRYLNISSAFGKGYLGVSGQNCCHNLSSSSEPSIVEDVQRIANIVRRRLFEASSNLPAVPSSGTYPPEKMSPIIISSGSLPAAMKQYHPPEYHDPPNRGGRETRKPTQLPPNDSPFKTMYIVVIACVVFVLFLFVILLCIYRKRGSSSKHPWATGLSGQLQKAFITAGVPKLNRTELESACEDFSNVIENLSGCTVYKGTLSSGVEIAVASTTVASYKHWSRRAEMIFRKKVDTLSRINHKNFINLLGYCEENEPFMRMMVFEYAPNGTLYEHLHVKDVEHIDWNSRVRIIMGMAYCLQHMHHELSPPVSHPNLQSTSVFLTDDFAAKIAEISFWTDIVAKSKIRDEEESEHSCGNSGNAFKTNILSFGILLLEIICGKVPYNEEEGSLLNWAADYWNDKKKLSYLIDPTLKSFKNNELDIICEVIQECINPEAKERPTMKEVIAKLREVIAISPEAATPKLSPVWWAELEILSVEAS